MPEIPAFAGMTEVGSGVFGGLVGPVEPRSERLDIGGVDRGAAPDAQTRRSIAIARDVIGGAFGLQQSGHLLDERLVGALDRQANAGLRARRRIGGEMAKPVARLDDTVERGGLGGAARLR